MTSIQSHTELHVYQRARAAAARIFELSLKFPSEEKFEMTNQIRRCSRSPVAGIPEAWRKRFYPAVFTSKIVECEGEAAEVQGWLDMALDCRYITEAEHQGCSAEYNAILGQLVNLRRSSRTWTKLNAHAPQL